jgi:hypothetical protein
MSKNDLSSMSQYQHSLEARTTMHYPIFQLLKEAKILQSITIIKWIMVANRVSRLGLEGISSCSKILEVVIKILKQEV